MYVILNFALFPDSSFQAIEVKLCSWDLIIYTFATLNTDLMMKYKAVGHLCGEAYN